VAIRPTIRLLARAVVVNSARLVVRMCNDFASACNLVRAASFNVYRPILASCRQRAGNVIAARQAGRGTSNPSAQIPATQLAAPVTVGNSGSIMRTECAKALCWGAKGKRVEMPGLSAHGTIDDLQLVFPEIGYAADRPKERSEQKATVAGTNHSKPCPGECSARKAIAATCHVNPGPECSEQKTAAATNHADPGLI